MLFKPADDALPRRPDAGRGLHLDFYLGAAAQPSVTLEVLDATGRVVHRAKTRAPDATDRWLPVMRPLPASPGHHRVVWNLRFDPPPAPRHRFEQLARTLFEDAPAEPDGPSSSRARTACVSRPAAAVTSQPIVVRNDPARDTRRSCRLNGSSSIWR